MQPFFPGPAMFRLLRRFRRLDRAVATLLLAALLVAGARMPWRDWFPLETIAGAARIVDGDSLFVEGREVRLAGIDAPELAQECRRDGREWPCGRVARQELAMSIRGNPLVCRVRELDRYGRALARCEAGGEDIGRAMVRSGFALAYGAYDAEEADARAAGRGIWAGSFERPAAWRERHPRPAD